MSHSLWSLPLHFPIYFISVLLVTKNGTVFEQSMHMSVANWFFKWPIVLLKVKENQPKL